MYQKGLVKASHTHSFQLARTTWNSLADSSEMFKQCRLSDILKFIPSSGSWAVKLLFSTSSSTSDMMLDGPRSTAGQTDEQYDSCAMCSIGKEFAKILRKWKLAPQLHKKCQESPVCAPICGVPHEL